MAGKGKNKGIIRQSAGVSGLSGAVGPGQQTQMVSTCCG
jgi:hypothetical protein